MIPASVSVVIPTFNEAMNLPWVLRRMPSYVDEVVIVDGRSLDSTVEVAKALRLDIVIVAEPRAGKGAAVRAGFAAASGDIIVMLDGDGSMDPQEIGWLVSPLQHEFDFVKGSRYVTGGGSDDITLLRTTGNRMLTALANLVLGSDFSDLCYGYIALRRECIEVLELQSDGFEIETELIVRASRAGLRIAEVPSHELARISGQLEPPHLPGRLARAAHPGPGTHQLGGPHGRRPARDPAAGQVQVPDHSVPAHSHGSAERPRRSGRRIGCPRSRACPVSPWSFARTRKSAGTCSSAPSTRSGPRRTARSRRSSSSTTTWSCTSG